MANATFSVVSKSSVRFREGLPGGSALWLCFALMLFLVQAVPYLSYRWVTDESWYAGPGYSVAQGHGVADPAIGPNDLENHFDARPPGTAIVIAGFFRALGPGAVSARLGSVLAGLVVVWLTFKLTRNVFGEAGAVVAALVVATDNLIVLTARTARPEALTIMAILVGMLAMKQYAQKNTMLWPFLSGLAMAVGTMFHITLLGYIVSLGLGAIIIDRMRGRLPLVGAVLYSLGFATGLVPFATWILTATRGREGFRAEFLSRAVQTSMFVRLMQEQRRYSDLIGLKMLHGHGLESIPLRLPIPLVFLFASFLLWRFRRSWFYTELLLLLPSLLWLIYTVNKSSRYLALLAPVFAMVIGGAIAATPERRTLHRAMLALATLVVVAQFGANLFLLRAARTANYTRLGAELRQIIPANEAAYGTITFWLALHDRPFISYERTTPQMAAETYHVRYFIVGDRMMTNSEAFGEKSFYQDLHEQLVPVIAKSEIAGSIQDPYYGDLTIYKLRP